MGIDEALLDERLEALERARAWSPRVIAKLEALLHAPDDEAVVRMNPLTFARERGIAPGEALDLFLHATRLGLLTLEWHLLCPRCGAAVESFASLRVVHSKFFCSLCTLASEANLDDFIQVSFTVAAAIRRTPFHDPDSLSARDYLFKLRFTREMHLMSVDGPRLQDLAPAFCQVCEWIEPGQRARFSFVARERGLFTASEFQAHTGTGCQVTDDAPGSSLEVVIGETATTASVEAVRVGTIELTVENRRAHRVVFVVAFHGVSEMEGDRPPDTVLEPIVTGAMLLANQTFRALFRSEVVEGQEGLGVRDVTILFSDLKGSTALYERIGDLKAFTMVQQHFERLTDAVQRHHGAVVKTIGDAVMAAFTQPIDAVRAALEMHAQIEAFNREHDTREIVLKIGVHRGPSIAVTLNQNLDYFGHTVNVAARVQGLADADEIYVTDDVFRADGVAEVLERVESRDVQLRGIQSQLRVHQASARR